MMSQLTILEDWKVRTCAIATMHSKEKVISPTLQAELGIQSIVPTGFDTDRFGTFTRDIRRTGNQLEAARKKALAAMEHTGLDLALASEGSFGTHPSVPLLPSNLEIVLLVDRKNNLEVIGQYLSSDVLVQSKEVRTPEEAVEQALAWGFSKQGVIVRVSNQSSARMYKESTTVDELRENSKTLLAGWLTKSIFIETDMRAHRCPARMESIKFATIDSVKNCRIFCPECNAPGFVVTDVIKGLPCSLCGLPTELAVALMYSCQKCSYTKRVAVEVEDVADPGHCERCNP